MKMVLSLVFLAGVTSLAEAQKAELTLYSINVEENDKTLETPQEIKEILLLDQEKEIEIFNNEQMRIAGTFKFARSGNRIKLVKNIFLQKNGETLKAKQDKDVQFIKASVPGKFDGLFRDTFLLDKKTLESVFVKFKYTFDYKPD